MDLITNQVYGVGGVDWLGVIVGAVLAFAGGWFWYSERAFGKQWAAGNGVELGSAQDMPIPAMITQAIGLLLVAWMVGVLEPFEFWGMALFAISVAVMMFSGGMFAKRDRMVLIIDAGYWIGAIVVMWIVQLIIEV
jgi:hypothetical protein